MLMTHHQKTANHKDHLKESKNTLCIFQRCPLYLSANPQGHSAWLQHLNQVKKNHLTSIYLGLFNYHSPHWPKLCTAELWAQHGASHTSGHRWAFLLWLLSSGSQWQQLLILASGLVSLCLPRFCIGHPTAPSPLPWHIPSQVGGLVFLYVQKCTRLCCTEAYLCYLH